MTIGIVGRKCGMSRIFTENGESVPVTLIEASPNRVAREVSSARTEGRVNWPRRAWAARSAAISASCPNFLRDRQACAPA